jgi:myo-inositol-1(or 4)-monophosphatase
VALAAAAAAVAVIRARLGTAYEIHAKVGQDFATDVDIDAERAARNVLSERRPFDQVVGEELGGEHEPGRRTWLVDPLCGTVNYAAGLPLVAVNVALVDEGGAVTAAVQADPFAREAFWTAGAGAWSRNPDGQDRPLRADAASGLVSVDCEPSARSLAGRLLVDPGFPDHLRPRVLSTTLALAWVAAGRMAAYLTEGAVHRSVHFAAGVALCEAAGAVVTDLGGAPLLEGADGLVVAADADMHQLLLSLAAPLL